MHPDKKVGLALGILLIGIVGALFFRNEAPDPDQNGPALANPQSLDSRIRHKPHAPYLPDAAPSSVAATTIPEVTVPEVSGQLGTVSGANASRPVPEPIRPNGARDREVSTPVPLPTREVVPTEPPVGRSDSKPSVVVHEVAPGESLSSIAYKYLGTHKRYKEIFEANKDILKSPDDLGVGMKLKIPPKDRPAGFNTSSANAQPEPPMGSSAVGTTTSSLAPTATPALSDTIPPTGDGAVSASATLNGAVSVPLPETRSDSPASSKPLFVRPRSAPPRAPTKTGKSLSQAAPPNVPSVDGVSIAREPTVIATRVEDEPATSEKR